MAFTALKSRPGPEAAKGRMLVEENTRCAYPAGMPKRSLSVVIDDSTQEFITAAAQLDD